MDVKKDFWTYRMRGWFWVRHAMRVRRLARKEGMPAISWRDCPRWVGVNNGKICAYGKSRDEVVEACLHPGT